MTDLNRRIVHWLARIDEALVQMLETDGPYPTGVIVEAEANLDLLTRQLDSSGLQVGLTLDWWHQYADQRIRELVRARGARGNKP